MKKLIVMHGYKPISDDNPGEINKSIAEAVLRKYIPGKNIELMHVGGWDKGHSLPIWKIIQNWADSKTRLSGCFKKIIVPSADEDKEIKRTVDEIKFVKTKLLMIAPVNIKPVCFLPHAPRIIFLYRRIAQVWVWPDMLWKFKWFFNLQILKRCLTEPIGVLFDIFDPQAKSRIYNRLPKGRGQ